MTDDERHTLRLVNDELRAIALQIETFEAAMEAGPDHIARAFLVWRLADHYRMETHLKETRAQLLAQEDA